MTNPFDRQESPYSHDLNDASTLPNASAWLATDAPSVESPKVKRHVSRRSVVLGATVATVGVGVVGAGVGVALTRFPHLLGQQSLSSSPGAITHLLRRAGFGASPADLSEYLNLGVSGAIDRLVNYSSVPNDVEQRLASYNFPLNTRTGQIRWWIARMTLTQRPLEEKLTLFWHGVLTSSVAKAPKSTRPMMIQQNNLLRSHAMGRFDDLIKAITTDPAMLYWLDGHSNTGVRPNENYSRELMELFTMGIGHYTQDDVQAGAKALSGWVVQNGQGVFNPRRFYEGTITYLGHTGHLGLDDVVRIVCAHPATATRIARLMWSFFVYDNPSASDIQPLVDAYNHSDHQIGAMVKAMFNAPAFFSEKAYRARVKSPAEFVIGAVRAMGLTPTMPLLAIMEQAMTVMGQTPLDPPNVAGWPGDKASSAWLSTQAWISRVNFINLLLGAATGALKNRTVAPSSGDSALQSIISAQRLGKPEDVLNYFVGLLFDNHLANDRHAILLDALNSPVANESGPALSLAGGAKIPATSVRQALYLLMSMPEFHMN